MLTGMKSYILAAVSVIYALGGWYTGNMDTHTAVGFALGGGALAALRAALPTTVVAIIGPVLDAIAAMNPPPPPAPPKA